MHRFHRIRHLARGFADDGSGNVLVLGALCLPVVIGVAGLATEYGLALAERSANQRVADLAAYAGASAYGKAASEADMQAAAERIAVLNGVLPKSIKVALVPSPKDPSQNAVHVRVVTERELFLSRVISKRASVDVAAQAYAVAGKAETGGASCILALDPAGSGLTLSGGVKVEAPDCTVSSNQKVTVPCGTTLTAKELTYGSADAPSQPCSGIKGPKGTAASIVNRHTPDPFEGSPKVAAGVERLTVASSLSYPPAPSVPTGPDIDFGWDQNATKTKASAAGCTATWNQPKWTLSCGSKKTINFGKLTMGGGIDLDFALDAPQGTMIQFSGIVTVTGQSVRFGAASYQFAKGLQVSGHAVFGNGASYQFGRHDCGYSVCVTGGWSLTLGGPAFYSMSHGFVVAGGATLTMGDGTANSYRFGPGQDGHAIRVQGGGKAFLADATGKDGRFEAKGGVLTDGGSCLALPAASNHDVEGPMSFSGGAILGAGLYAVDGHFALGDNGGGNVSCYGRTVSLDALDVTLVLSGSTVAKGWSCKDSAFCVAAGYSNVKLIAPKDGPAAGFAVIGPQDPSVNKGATFAEGGSGAMVSGVFYFPHGPVQLKGGSSILGKSGIGCLQVVGTWIELSGGTAAASECKEAAGGGKGGGVTAVVRLVR